MKTDSMKGMTLVILVTFSLAVTSSGSAQTKIHVPRNFLDGRVDLEAGKRAAAQAEVENVVLQDKDVADVIDRVGRRLVSAVPAEYRQPQYDYYFKVLDTSELQLLALPGGPMYLSRALVVTARNEGELAGIIAHGLAHILLRHGTAQAIRKDLSEVALSQATTKLSSGRKSQIALDVAQLGMSTYFLKLSRGYETQADILGIQIMARAGYDPHDYANFINAIEQNGSSAFFGAHPSKKDRFSRINREAQYLQVLNRMPDNGDLERIRTRLSEISASSSTERSPGSSKLNPIESAIGGRSNNSPRGRVDAPSTRYQSYSTLGGILRVSVPNNWQQEENNNSIWFSPEGAYGQYQNQVVYTHGVNFGLARTQSRNLQQATQEFLNGLTQVNGNLRQRIGLARSTVGGRTGLTTTLTNVNEATGLAEVVTVITTQLRDGQLFYMLAVAPENESASYQTAFRNVLRSLQING